MSEWQEYWARRGAEIRRRRREAYASDARLRSRVRRANASRQRSRPGRRVMLREELSLGVRLGDVVVGGARYVGFPLRKVAVELGCAPQTIRAWVKGGVIPVPFVDRSGQWWFTEAYVRFLRRVLDKRRRCSWRLCEFGRLVWLDFMEDGAFIPERVMIEEVGFAEEESDDRKSSE